MPCNCSSTSRCPSAIPTAPHSLAKTPPDSFSLPRAHERLMDTKTAADVLGISPRTLEDWRWRGGGPRFLRLSRNCIRYRHADLLDWADGKSQRSTHFTPSRPRQSSLLGQPQLERGGQYNV